MEKNPNSWYGIIHLFDQLVDDCRYDAAIHIRKEQRMVIAEEWRITQGETVDEILREITGLEKRLQ